MLKIAEYNKKTGKKIELKELEKYGFNLDASHKVGTHDFMDNFVDDNYGFIIKGGIYIYDRDDLISTKKNFLQIIVVRDGFGEKIADEDLDTLYDLITDGYIEKVENER